MSAARRLLGIALAAALLAALSALTRTPYRAHAEGALLRLSWRLKGEEIERCRRATPAELAGVPAHMRQEVICEERRVAPYQLSVVADGHTLVNERAPGSDVAGDRPMLLLRDLALAPGVHHVRVSLERVGDAGPSDTLRAREGRRRAIPPRLALDTTLRVDAQSIALVTYSSELQRLVVLVPDSVTAPR